MTDLTQLATGLLARFETGPRTGGRHVLFWHDPDAEYENEVDALAADLNVQVMRVQGNEYAIKHRLLKVDPSVPFIVYRSGEIPAGVDNWLLDLELAYGVFTADRASMLARDLQLDATFLPLLRKHERFFKSNDRAQRLRALLSDDDDAAKFRAKMSAVLLKQKVHQLSELTRTLLMENAEGSSGGIDALTDHGLAHFFWRGVRDIYGYRAESPSIEDFVFWIFKSAHENFETSARGLPLDFIAWRNDVRSRGAMATLARRAEGELGVADWIRDDDYRQLLATDAFEVVDQKIVRDLARAVEGGTATARDVLAVERSRQTTFWYNFEPQYKSQYTAIRCAAELLEQAGGATYGIVDFDGGLTEYSTRWFIVDQLYRQFLLHARRAEASSHLDALITKVEGYYANNFVVPLATEWQKQVNAIAAPSSTWAAKTIPSQQTFYRTCVEPIRQLDKRVVVVISDALRYEVAHELASRIRQENRFQAELEPMLGVVPGYTQLGMASLLPHSTLGFKGTDKNSNVLVDGKPSDGTANRSKILADVGGIAIQASDLNAKTVHELRSWLQEHKVVYVYHDVIDRRSHKLGAESGTPAAVEDAIGELVGLVKRLGSAEAANVIVTADHGFLFQESKLDDSSFLPEEAHGDIKFRDRRFLLGGDFKASDAYVTFEPEQLGLAGDWQVHVPKSIYRTRLQGAADRFVHGGTTLQEIVVPVIKIERKSKSDVRPVKVQIRPSADKITAAAVVVNVLQEEPVSEKVHSRSVTAGLYIDDQLLSTQEQVVFDSTSDDLRERMQQVRLRLSADADAHNGKQIELRLEEQVGTTNQTRRIGSAMFTLQRSFSTDF